MSLSMATGGVHSLSQLGYCRPLPTRIGQRGSHGLKTPKMVQSMEWPSFPGGEATSQSGSIENVRGAEGAKNPRVNVGYSCQTFFIGTYNVRSLKSEDRLEEMEEELRDIKWNIIGLAEVRRSGEGSVKLRSGNILFYGGSKSGRNGGVGFMVNGNMEGTIRKFESISERIAQLTVQVSKRVRIRIIQVYCPTSSSDEEEIEEVYNDLFNLINKAKSTYLIVMGDFNAKVGLGKNGEHSLGRFGIGERNERGERLVDFAVNQRLYIMNTFFQKKENKKWTWRSPNGEIKNEIDFIMANDKRIFKDVTVINRFNTGSDHRLVRGEIKIDLKVERNKMIERNMKGACNMDMGILRAKSVEYEMELKHRFQELQEDVDDIDELNGEMVDIIMEVVEDKAQISIKKESKISEDTKLLLKKRREMNRDKHNVEYSELCKTIRKKMRQDVREYNTEKVREAIEKNTSITKAKRDAHYGQYKIECIKDAQGNVVRDRREIMGCIEKFYKNLYKECYMSIKDEEIHEPQLMEDNDIPDILPSEVETTLRSMRRGKAPGRDRVTAEMMQLGGGAIVKAMAKLFTKCVQNKRIPLAWKNSIAVLIYKKGDRTELKNYRPISLLSCIYRVFSKIIANRLTKELDFQQPREQAGFRSKYSTIDHLQTLGELQERCGEYEKPMCLAFIDYEKAFDTVSTDAVIYALKEQGISDGYIRLFKDIYSECTSQIRLHELSQRIPIEKGVRQGDSLSPKLFSAVLESVFRRLDWEEKGMNIDGERFTNLRFADDVVLVSEKCEELEEMINELNRESLKVGLKMNREKTKVLFNPFVEEKTIMIGDLQLESVEEIKYLGKILNKDGTLMPEIVQRIRAGWSAMGKLKNVMTGRLPLCLKRKAFNQCVLPAMVYGSETWTLTAKMIQKLQTAQRSMERYMLGITKRERKRINWIRDQTGVIDVICHIKLQKWRWAGHVARTSDNRWTKRLLEWRPRDARRPQGRPRQRWRDEIVRFGGARWMSLALDRRGWRVLGEAFAQQWA